MRQFSKRGFVGYAPLSKSGFCSSPRRLYCTTASASTAEPSLQELFWKDKVCYGCGPANDQGLHLRSFLLPPPKRAGKMPGAYHSTSIFVPQPQHVAIPDVLSGGVLATVLDCHCNILAAYTLMRLRMLCGGAAALSFDAMERIIHSSAAGASTTHADTSIADAVSPVAVATQEGGKLPAMTVTAEMHLRLVRPTPLQPLRIYGAVDIHRSLALHRSKKTPVAQWRKLHVSAVCAPLILEQSQQEREKEESEEGKAALAAQRHMSEETVMRLYCIPVQSEGGQQEEPLTTNIMSLATVEFDGTFIALPEEQAKK